jgi:hypothetical protein
MTRFFYTRWVVHLLSLLLLLIVGACKTSPGTPPPTEASPTSAPTEAPTEQPGELNLEQELVFGPGSFIYTDPRAGLADLAGYQAELIMAFEGAHNGQPWKWSQTYKLLADNESAARTWTLEKSGDLPDPEPVFQAEMNGLVYERRGEGECIAAEIQQGDALAERFELASFLTGVIGADEAGSETVNGVAANHYTFDQRALGQQDLTESTGELWVASEGGHLVRYLLTTKAGAEYFGEGIEGTMTLSYELTAPTQPVTVELPEGCPPGLVDAPLLPDAANVDNFPGALSYDTSTSLAEAMSFYQEQLPGLGWQPEGDPQSDDTTAYLAYKKDAQTMSVIITSDGMVTQVSVFVGEAAESAFPSP